MANILIVGKGGYGDMFPLFAIAQELKASGHTVTVAAESHHATAASSIGIPLIAIDAVRDSTENKQKTGLLSKSKKIGELFRTLSPSSIEDEYEILSPAVKSNDLIIGNQLAYSGKVASRKWGKPWIFCPASPMAIPSFLDPPQFPYLHKMQRIAATSGLSQSLFIKLARHSSQLLMLSNIRFQKRLNVYDNLHPRFEGIYSNLLNIMPVSPAILTARSDWPNRTVVTGFNWFEPSFMLNPRELVRLSAFLEAGDRPIVIAPGGIKRTQPGGFFAECLAACKLLNARAIVVAANRFHDQIAASSNVFVTGYIPYSVIFQNAAAVVHSAGIGTIGWSLRYAVPSLLIPTDWDQFDNAYRVKNLGLASVLSKSDLVAPRIAKALESLLGNRSIKASLAQVSKTVAAEDGVKVSLAEIKSVLGQLI